MWSERKAYLLQHRFFADETGGTGGIGEPVAELVKVCGYDALAGSTSAIAAAGVCRKRINR